MSADTRIHVQQSVDNALIALLQTNISLQLANAGVERSCAIHEGLHAWCESLISAAESEAAAFAREQRRTIAEAAAVAKNKSKPVSNPSVDANRVPSIPPDHAATLRRPPQKIDPNSNPGLDLSSPSTASTLVSPIAAAAPVPIDPYGNVRITPAAGSTSRGPTGGGGRRQFPQQATRPTLMSDEDQRALEFGRMALEEAEQGRIAQEMEDAVLLNARNPSGPSPAGDEEISGLFGAPKRVDKSVKLSPYLNQIAATGSKKKKPVAATTTAPASASNKKPKSSPISESLSAKKKPPARSPERPPRHSPAQPTTAAPVSAFNLANLSLDAILAQAKYVQAFEDDDEQPPPAAAAISHKPSRTSAPSSCSFVPSAAMVTTAATAAKQRSKPIASPAAAAADGSARKWNPGYGAVTKAFTGSLSDLSGRELTGPYVPSSSAASAVLAHRKKLAKANRPSALASDNTAAFAVQHAPASYHDEVSDSFHDAHSSFHHPHHPSDDAGSVHSYAVHYAASSGTSSAGHSRRSSARFQPPPPPPPPPSIPAPSSASTSTPPIKASNAFKFPRAFIDLTSRFQLLKQSLHELNERRRNVWSNPSIGPAWKASQLSFLRTAAHLQPNSSDSHHQQVRASQIEAESLTLSEAYQQQYVSESAETCAEPCPTIEARYGPAPFAPLNPWLQYTSNASPITSNFQYPFTKSNLASMQRHILAERKSRAQARRASTMGLEPLQSEVNEYASQTLLLFEEDMSRLTRARIEESIETTLAVHLEPILANAAQLSTAEAVPLLKLAYSTLHAGGRLGPRNRHGQARKAAPIFLPTPHSADHPDDDDAPVIRTKSNLWLAADEAAAARAQLEGSIDELNRSREEEEEQYQASAEELQAMQDEDLDA